MAPDTAQGLRITLSIMSGTWPVQVATCLWLK